MYLIIFVSRTQSADDLRVDCVLGIQLPNKATFIGGAGLAEVKVRSLAAGSATFPSVSQGKLKPGSAPTTSSSPRAGIRRIPRKRSPKTLHTRFPTPTVFLEHPHPTGPPPSAPKRSILPFSTHHSTRKNEFSGVPEGVGSRKFCCCPRCIASTRPDCSSSHHIHPSSPRFRRRD